MGRAGTVSMVTILAAASQANLLLSALPKTNVALVDQSSLIVWDPATKTEHLVQTSTFLSKANRFDIIVPTPTMPKVETIGPTVFDRLMNVLHPATDLVDFGGQQTPTQPVKAPSVGYLKTTSLKASDVVALYEWMDKNGYKPSMDQRKWLETYVVKGWYLTMLQVQTNEESFRTLPIRLSFKTNAPVAPTSTPDHTWLAGVRRQTFLLSPENRDGYYSLKKSWSAEPESHAYVTTTITERLMKDLKLASNDLPGKAWVNRFVEMGKESTSPDDLVFLPKTAVKKQTKARKPTEKPTGSRSGY
ncbi:MAG: DUF2330 domain-containing protein [Armatimonadetes bacterium]|nr:DUF2330 domain-containing protein [Armatimonadota bacterium]